MRAVIVLSGAVLSLAGVCLQFAVEHDHGVQLAQVGEIKKQVGPADAAKDKPAASKPAAKAPAAAENKQLDNKASDHAQNAADTKAAVKDNDALPESRFPAIPEKYAADEKAIREVHQELSKAYSADDAKAAAALFARDAEYINAHDAIFQGRAEIEKSLAEFMAEHPGCKLESDIQAIRFVSPTIALMDGHAIVTHAEHAAPTHCHFKAVYAKTDGKWLVASVQDHEVFAIPSHEEQLSQLNFLLGDWVDEHEHSVVSFSCKPTDNGKFLLREFSVHLNGQEAMTGSQRIGWDPVSGQLRTWIFDSEGGFGEGAWQQNGDGWVLHASGVTSNGEPASGSSIYKVINDHTMTWQAVDHEVGGVSIPDSPVFTLTHRAPAPAPHEEQAEVSQNK